MDIVENRLVQRDVVGLCNAGVQPARNYKAQADCARCMVCTIKFHSDDLRENVYKDDRLVGVIHEQCYPLLWAARA